MAKTRADVPIFPIYIPSKGRSDITRGTTNLLDDAKLNYLIIVEPQDAKAYRARYGKRVVVLPKNDQGRYYACKYIHYLARKAGHRYYWQIDDDVRRFIYRSPGTKQQTVPPGKALRAMEIETLRFKNIGLAGTNQNSWPPSKYASKINNLPVQCILTRTDVKSRYRDATGVVDVDFTLQVLTEGWCTILFDHLRVDTPPIGTNQGGCFMMYKNLARRREVMKEMCEKYPTMSYIEDDKGPHLRRGRVWQQFQQRPIPA